MKWLAVAVGVVAAMGCDFDFQNPHLGPRGLTEEDIKAPPGKREIKSAIINDVRDRRSLLLRLSDGRREPPPELKFDKYGMEAVRAKDGYELWRVTIKADPVERVHAVNEIAYWDNERHEYYYHYEGGNPHRDVWMGPYAVKFSKPPEEHDHQH